MGKVLENKFYEEWLRELGFFAVASFKKEEYKLKKNIKSAYAYYYKNCLLFSGTISVTITKQIIIN